MGWQGYVKQDGRAGGERRRKKEVKRDGIRVSANRIRVASSPLFLYLSRLRGYWEVRREESEGLRGKVSG